MKTAIRLVVLIYVLSVIVLSTAWSSTCDDGFTATTLVYVNGIDNDRWAAISSMVDVTRKVKEYIANNPLESGCLKKSRLAYNHNELFLADLTQSAIQAGIEQIERFWHFFANLEIAPDWFQEAAADSAMNVGISDADVNEHVKIYREEISSNNNVVIVSHSQGNFYANRAYDDLTDGEKDVLKIVAVATPSHFVAGDGPYTTLTEDFIANFVFPPTRLSPNIQNGAPICEIGDNWSCHSFSDSYILGVKSGPQIIGHIVDAINAPTEPETQYVAYVTHSTIFRSVTVLSVPDNNIIDTVPTAARPTRVIFLPNRKFAYITAPNDKQVLVFDTSNHMQIASLSFGRGVSGDGIAATPDSEFVYVSNSDDFAAQLHIIQTSDHTVITTISLRNTLPPADTIAMYPDGTFLYMIHESEKTLSVMRIADNFFIVLQQPLFENLPRNLRFAPDGERAYATQFNPQNNLYELVVINTTDVNNITVERIVPLRGNVVDIALTPEGDFIYMTIDLGLSHEVAIIRTSDYATLSPIPLETNLVGIAITPDGNFAYVAIHGAFPEDGNEVAVIDTRTNTVVDRISTNANPGFITIAEVPVSEECEQGCL